ncbi:hypothetical protein QR680_008556 [Steinernema hermaphroditum]|uniref:Uncharacterized protein n=1 Tax=Steinernema hermaphroditum TaxID=289476 RepID=A0AA39IJG9_9BILA|nr:hypothetical protein QR680_008556 [Steinernema hermaphroditum]
MFGILPIKGSDDWMISIVLVGGTNDDNSVKILHIHDLKDFPEDSDIVGLGIGANGWHRDWDRISAKFAKEELMPFIIRKLKKGARIQFHGLSDRHKDSNAEWHHTEEVTKIAEIVFGALNASTCKFLFMEIAYYGPFCEEFVATQIEAGFLDSLDLYGWWPNGAVPLIKAYLERYEEPRITLTKENKIPISLELFDSLFAKFLEAKLCLRNMDGTISRR